MVKIGKLTLKNPILLASGTFGYGDEIFTPQELAQLGGIVTKGLSLKPREGNPQPRIAEVNGGVINSIGLQNIGLERFKKEKIPFYQRLKTRVMVNFFGESLADYLALARELDQISCLAALELNISCPNVKRGGMAWGTNEGLTRKLVSRLRRIVHKPLIVKLTPNDVNIVKMARIVEAEGVDAISLVNTFKAMKIDLKRKAPEILGGLSGPIIKPLALRLVWEVAQAVTIPVIGIGGIACLQDVLEFLAAGAKAVQIGTANLINPRISLEIVRKFNRS